MSSITNYDYMRLIASIEAMEDKKFNCIKCKSRYGKSREVKAKAYRKRMGCFDYNTTTYERDNIIFRGCIGNFRDLSVNYYLELFIKYEAGIMPYNGTFQDQPAKIIEIFKVIGNIRDKLAKDSGKYGKRN